MIQTRIEGSRGCGTRKEGGLYLVADGLAAPCGRLPIPLDVCPCCGEGIKPSRGWTWIDLQALSDPHPCKANAAPALCATCPLGNPPRRAGLIWVGEAYYPTPEDFTREARDQGISRRIPHVPRGFKTGKTWVALGHRKAIPQEDTWKAGIFHLYRPTAIEYVVTGDETQEDLEKMIRRGVTPVRILNPQQDLDLN